MLGVSLFVMTWGSYRRDQAMLREGLHAEGTVLKKEFLAVSDDSDFILVYAFTPQGGERQEHQRNVSPELWKRLRVGDRIQVRYGRSDVRHSFPEGQGVMSLGLALFFSVVLVPFTLIGAVALFARAVPEAPPVASTSLPPSS
nr:DUF3592 domain-containing protein [Corallococcus exercitus]